MIDKETVLKDKTITEVEIELMGWLQNQTMSPTLRMYMQMQIVTFVYLFTKMTKEEGYNAKSR